ncbi:MAG: ATP-binding cassette domain-containing protein [Acidobacteriota bacterium]
MIGTTQHPVSAEEAPRLTAAAVSRPQGRWALETDSLTKRFGRKMALDSLTLRIARGGVHALVGSNGAGKSTLFRLLLGLLRPTAGACSVLGTDCANLAPEVRGRIGLVHEEHTLPGWMSIERLRLMHRDLYRCWNEKIYREVLGHFNVLPEQQVRQLSRGERAGVNLALALALAQSPQLLMLDEPTLGLDVVAKQAFLEALLFAGEDPGRTIVYCSHQMDEIERVAEDLVILEGGRLVHHSPPDDFLQRIAAWTAIFPPGPLPVVPGLLQTRRIEERTELVVIDPDRDFPALLASLGGDDIVRSSVGFDRAVNAFLTRGHSAPNSPDHPSPDSRK